MRGLLYCHPYPSAPPCPPEYPLKISHTGGTFDSQDGADHSGETDSVSTSLPGDLTHHLCRKEGRNERRRILRL